jgi:hypothetical protein
MSRLKGPKERASRCIKVWMTEAEYAQVERTASKRKLQLGPCLRAILNDYLRTQLSRETTLILEAIAEVQANHLDVLRKSFSKQLTAQTLEEIAEYNRHCRRDLVHGFLASIPARETIPKDDDEDDYGDEE